MNHTDAGTGDSLPVLGTLDELPEEYRASLHQASVVPLWPNLRSFLPPLRPEPRTKPTRWSYQAMRPLLLRAGELTPIEKAERRVLALCNPGHGFERMKVTPSIYLGMQLLLPGEIAPSHRHTPNAARMVVEGTGAYTEVEGEKYYMSRGDLILTPSGMWHEHGHDGVDPVIWLDILDLPLIYEIEAAYVEEGRATGSPLTPDLYATGGLVPSRNFRRSGKAHPIIRYPWVDVRAALERQMERVRFDELVQVSYVDPETGEDSLKAIAFHAVMLRPAQCVDLPVRSCAAVFHLIDGSIDVSVDQVVMTLDSADTCSAPGFSRIRLSNRRSSEASFVFIADESPLQVKLGVYEMRS